MNEKAKVTATNLKINKDNEKHENMDAVVTGRFKKRQ